MTLALPDILQGLLSASGPTRQAAAWSRFLEEHSNLLLHVARRMGGDHDAVMDRYSYVLEVLQREGYQRLRAYTDDGRGSFSTWLTVVVRRLCLDEHRHRYGRLQGGGPDSRDRHLERRHLVDLVGDELALDAAAAAESGRPDEALSQGELGRALAGALARLDVSDRLVLRLRFEDGLSVPQIARLLGDDSPFRLYRRITRMLSSLRESLEHAGVRDSVP